MDLANAMLAAGRAAGAERSSAALFSRATKEKYKNLGSILLVVGKVVLYRDTGSVDPGSGPIFGSASGSEIHILGIAYAKDTFYLR